MKKVFFLLVLLTQATYAFANEKEIVLPKKYKVLETFSGALSDEISFHIIFTKNKELRKKEQLIYTFNGYKTQKIAVLDVLEGSILSHHFKDDVLTLIEKKDINNSEYVRTVNIIFSTGKNEVNNWLPRMHKSDPIVLDGKTCLIDNNSYRLQIHEFQGDDKPVINNLVLKENELSDFFNGDKIKFVKTDEFVPFGATTKYKMYSFNNKIYFTLDLSKKLITKVLTTSVDCDVNQTSLVELPVSNLNVTFKRLSSYFFKDFLVQLAISKERAFIKLWSLNSNKPIAHFSIDDAFIEEAMKGNDFSTLNDFLKYSTKKGNKPTITVNETKEGNMLIRVDYQFPDYTYNYNWFHHHMWMQQQMMMNNSIKGFGPFHFDNELPFLRAESNKYLQFVVNKQGKLIQGNVLNTVYKEIDKKEFISKLLEFRNLKKTSFCFIEHKFRYVGYNKKEKKLVFNQEQQR